MRRGGQTSEREQHNASARHDHTPTGQSLTPAACKCPAAGLPALSPPGPLESPPRRWSGNPNSSALHCSADSGAARQNSGSSDNGRPNLPSTSCVSAGAQAASTWKFLRCRTTERKPTVLQSMPVWEAVGPASSAAVRTAARHHWAKAGCHPPYVLAAAGTRSYAARGGGPPW